MAHAEGRTCEEIDMELDAADEELDRLRSSLRAAEAERDDARALYTETEIAAANRIRDLSREVGALEDRLRAAENTAEENKVEWYAAVKSTRDECDRADAAETRARAAEERAESRFDCRRGPGWSSADPPCGACATCLTRALEAAERRAEGLAEAVTCVEGLAGLWETFRSDHIDSRVEKTLRSCATQLRTALARPRSEETPTSPEEPAATPYTGTRGRRRVGICRCGGELVQFMHARTPQAQCLKCKAWQWPAPAATDKEANR